MDTNIFYAAVGAASFTLLGLWWTALSFAEGGWRDDQQRRRLVLHVALGFLLLGSMGLVSLLSGATDDGLIWRIAFVAIGGIGLRESLDAAPGGSCPVAPLCRRPLLDADHRCRPPASARPGGGGVVPRSPPGRGPGGRHEPRSRAVRRLGRARRLESALVQVAPGYPATSLGQLGCMRCHCSGALLMRRSSSPASTAVPRATSSRNRPRRTKGMGSPTTPRCQGPSK